MLIRMANHAPVVLVAGNHGAELDGGSARVCEGQGRVPSLIVKEPRVQADLSDLDVDFRLSPTRRMVELQAVYENGDFHFRTPPDMLRLKDARVKVVVSIPKGPHASLGRDDQERLRERLLEANPAELKVKIEPQPENEGETTPLSVARTAEDKLRAYWALKGAPPVDQQQRLLCKLAQVESAVLSQHI